MNLNDFFNRHRKPLVFDMLENCPRIECKDGFTISVQASRFHYSEPRENSGPYTRVEVGFPTEKCEELMEYAENASEPTDTVYAYVPIEIVEALIEKHGGA